MQMFISENIEKVVKIPREYATLVPYLTNRQCTLFVLTYSIFFASEFAYHFFHSKYSRSNSKYSRSNSQYLRLNLAVKFTSSPLKELKNKSHFQDLTSSIFYFHKTWNTVLLAK